MTLILFQLVLKATTTWTTTFSASPKQSCPRSDPRLRESRLLWTSTYQVREPTVHIWPRQRSSGPSCGEWTLSGYEVMIDTHFHISWPHCVSRKRYFPTISAMPLTIPKDPPLPGPGQYDIGGDKSLHWHSMPSAAFASKTERIPQSFQVDTGPGPGKGL